MKKHFIKKTQDYSCKNKLQKLIWDSLKTLDGTLTENQDTAIHLIKLAYKFAVDQYKGKAKVSELCNYEADNKTAVFYVPEVIYLSIYEVEHDLTLNPDNKALQKFYERTNP